MEKIEIENQIYQIIKKKNSLNLYGKRKETDLQKDDIGAVLDAFKEVMRRSLKKSGEFLWRDCFNIKVVERKARICHNPQNGEKMSVPAKKAIKIRLSKKYTNTILS